MISPVARIFKPGCQADHVLILEELQGRLKSEALRALAIRDEWFTDRISHISSKDAALETTSSIHWLTLGTPRYDAILIVR